MPHVCRKAILIIENCIFYRIKKKKNRPHLTQYASKSSHVLRPRIAKKHLKRVTGVNLGQRAVKQMWTSLLFLNRPCRLKMIVIFNIYYTFLGKQTSTCHLLNILNGHKNKRVGQKAWLKLRKQKNNLKNIKLKFYCPGTIKCIASSAITSSITRLKVDVKMCQIKSEVGYLGLSKERRAEGQRFPGSRPKQKHVFSGPEEVFWRFCPDFKNQTFIYLCSPTSQNPLIDKIMDQNCWIFYI